MIDVETRNRILELWKKGNSKTAIKDETGVSLPTVRKIIKEAGLDKKPSQHEVPSLEERVKAMETMFYELTISVRQARHDAMEYGRGCDGIEDEGFCMDHTLDEEVDNDLLNVKRVEDPDEELGYFILVNVEKHPLFCAGCSHLDWKIDKLWGANTILTKVEVPHLLEQVKNMGEEIQKLKGLHP